MMKKIIITIITCLCFSAIASDIPALRQGEIHLQDIKRVNNPLIANAFNQQLSDKGQHNVMDVVVFYQPSFMSHWGEQVGYSRIHRWIDTANQALINSGIDASYRVVNVTPTINIPEELQYTSVRQDDGSYINGAGYLFSTKVLNEYPGHTENEIYWQYGGDLVMYVRQYQGEKTSETGNAVKGFAAIGGESAVIFDWQVKYPEKADDAGQTVTHEFGHLLGGNHERADNSFPAQQKSYAVAYECGGNTTGLWSSSSVNSQAFYSSR